MSDAPERIWIDAWGGNWSPVSGGTQEIEYIRADRIEALKAKLAKALEALEFYATQDVIYPHVGKVTYTGYDDDGSLARATLAEIKGESHD
jgi:hypothetical protein